MKKFFAMTLALAMVLGLTACGGDSSSSSSAPDASKDYSTMTLDELKAELTTIESGKLSVATSPDYAPYEFYAIDDNGTATLAGFDMALAQYIADDLGLTLEVIPMSFNGILGEMAAGSADLAIAGLSPDPDREEAMLFSDIYYAGKQAFVTTKTNVSKFTDLASTNKPEFSIGVQTGTIQNDLAQEHSPDSDIVNLPKATDIIAELVSGKLDGAYVEYDVAVAYQANYPELEILCEVPYEADGNIIGVQKNNPALLAAVNLSLNKCVDEGTFGKFVAEALDLAAGNTASYVDGEIVPDA